MKFILFDKNNDTVEEFNTLEEARTKATEWLDDDGENTLEGVKLYKVADSYTIVGTRKVLFHKEGTSESE